MVLHYIGWFQGLGCLRCYQLRTLMRTVSSAVLLWSSDHHVNFHSLSGGYTWVLTPFVFDESKKFLVSLCCTSLYFKDCNILNVNLLLKSSTLIYPGEFQHCRHLITKRTYQIFTRLGQKVAKYLINNSANILVWKTNFNKYRYSKSVNNKFQLTTLDILQTYI